MGGGGFPPCVCIQVYCRIFVSIWRLGSLSNITPFVTQNISCLLLFLFSANGFMVRELIWRLQKSGFETLQVRMEFKLKIGNSFDQRNALSIWLLIFTKHDAKLNLVK